MSALKFLGAHQTNFCAWAPPAPGDQGQKGRGGCRADTTCRRQSRPRSGGILARPRNLERGRPRGSLAALYSPYLPNVANYGMGLTPFRDRGRPIIVPDNGSYGPRRGAALNVWGESALAPGGLMRPAFRAARMARMGSVWALPRIQAAFRIRYTRNDIHTRLVYTAKFPILAWVDQPAAPGKGKTVRNHRTRRTATTNAKREGPQPTPNSNQQHG